MTYHDPQHEQCIALRYHNVIKRNGLEEIDYINASGRLLPGHTRSRRTTYICKYLITSGDMR